ncbi:elongation factor, putative [Trypanosoma brucei gambiense DAL972]|uniref:Elongation factor, putative n=1 Tax=Trypanosoma brucei gambiense (strain MHOM/CI/86/DAL972) TaxID=679716 RepID=D0A5E0_TRYB9|nr:elongation factor, putative [Trypanosoma brucei gambiense DAL972]CBH16891.1 elongation factor, putative [Trypanosoma brucei gambiense DAL972]|eukprot:XP_011779155.1 elongation factor, putative [Trypanosoma brucei gambiense DAL972]
MTGHVKMAMRRLSCSVQPITFRNAVIVGLIRYIKFRQDVRNVAVIAHVDHGKTTLVDEMLKQSGTLVEARNRVMDSKDQEKERGITILAKNTAIILPSKGDEPQRRINIVDTPGHLDFSGEVERALQMVEGIILLVDAKEGVRPGTRYVLRKSLAMRLKPIVCLNKIDKDDTNIKKTEDGVQDLFLETAEDDSQLDMTFLYGSGRNGYMNDTPKKEGTLSPLFEKIFDVVPAPTEDDDAKLQLLVSQVEVDESTGHKTAIGRIFKGSVSVGDIVTVALEAEQVDALVKSIQLYVGMEKINVQTAAFGDICVLNLQEPIGQKVPVRIGSTVCSQGVVDRFPYRKPDEPTYSLVMQASEASWRKKEANEQLGTIAVLQKRLEREALVNTALQLVGLGSPHIKLMGRGPLHLSVIIEDMRREGYEFEVQAPRIVTKTINGEMCEPYERVTLEFRENLVGDMVSFFSSKMAEIGEITQLSDGRVCMECLMPVRLLSHVPLRFHTLTAGDGVLNHSFDSYKPMTAAETGRETGALVATEDGEVTDWSLAGQAQQGRFFVLPGDSVYYGQIVGENTKTLFQNLGINVCKRNEQLGGMRANANDKAGRRKSSYAATRATFEECIAWVTDEELVTVTPKSIRMRLPNFNGKTTMRNATKRK